MMPIYVWYKGAWHSLSLWNFHLSDPYLCILKWIQQLCNRPVVFCQAQNAALEAQANTELAERIKNLEQEVARHKEDSGKAQAEVDRLLEILREMENEKNDKDKKISELERWVDTGVTHVGCSTSYPQALPLFFYIVVNKQLSVLCAGGFWMSWISFVFDVQNVQILCEN